jgi:hypothetical protein
MKSLALASLLAVAVIAYDNNVPIPRRRPGFSVGGNSAEIEIDVIYDLMCSDSRNYDPFFQRFLHSPFNNATVLDNVKITYSFLPLPFHHENWIPHVLLPYFMDRCIANKSDCELPYNYTVFSFKNQGSMLSATDSTHNELVQKWTNMVSQAFNISQSELLQCYSSGDTHDSEMRVREMFKFNT